ncbi:MAG: hypothetical protein L0H94_05830 [Nitrospira sp.]|nr:hypothetical protein [Nitrospira sp.]
MEFKRREIDDGRDTSLELPDSYFEDFKPGFKPAEKKRKEVAAEGHHRFPRVSKRKDVPQTPLAKRIRRAVS